MSDPFDAFVRIALFVLILLLWLWVIDRQFSGTVDLFIIVGGVLSVFPIIWFGRKMLDKNPTMSRVVRITLIGFLDSHYPDEYFDCGSTELTHP